MYNDFQKKRYLDSPSFRFEEQTKEVIRLLFEGAEKTESQEGIDLCEFNRPQVISLFKSYNSRSKPYLRLISSYFSDYYNWCLQEGYVDKTNFTNYYDYKITKTIIDDVVPLSLIEDKHFLKKEVLEYKKQIPDPMNQFVLYAPFCGIYGNEYDDLTNLKFDDINIEEKTVKLQSGKTIHVDDMFIELARKADEATMYYPDGEESISLAKKPNRYVYDQSIYIIKNSGADTVNVPVTKTVIMNRFRLMQKQLNNKFINGSNLYKNGLINHIKERFEEQEVTLKQAFFEKKDSRDYVYSKELQQYINEFGSQMTDRMLRLQMQDIIDLYN